MGNGVGFESHSNVTKLRCFASVASLSLSSNQTYLGLKPCFLTRRLFLCKIVVGQIVIDIN